VIAAKHGAAIDYRPILLGGVFKAIDNRPPAAVKPKGAWMWRDLGRFAERYGVPLRMNPHFPVNTLSVMSGAVVAADRGELPAYSTAVFDAIWRDGLDMADPGIIAGVLAEGGFAADAYMAGAADPDIKAALIARTEEAVNRGVFGAPTFFVGDEMFWGQDRLDFVDEALAAQAA